GEQIDGVSLRALMSVRRGEDFASKGEFGLALTELNNALWLNPALARAYLVRGKIRFELGDLESARQDFRRALELNPGHGEANSLLSEIDDPAQIQAAHLRSQKQRPVPLFVRTVSENVRSDISHILWVLGAIALLASILIAAFFRLDG